jgi:hypothetical protein
MNYTLTLYADTWLRDGPVYAGGIVTGYRVVGMPAGEEARIANYGAPNRNDWRIMRISGDKQSGWTGNYESAEAALAVLQSEYK